MLVGRMQMERCGARRRGAACTRPHTPGDSSADERTLLGAWPAAAESPGEILVHHRGGNARRLSSVVDTGCCQYSEILE